MADHTAISLYERLLARGDLSPPAPPPRASAAVVPWRRRDDGTIEVFWVRRSPSLAFMGGWYAFPGGAQSRHDAELTVGGAAAGLSAATRTPPDPEEDAATEPDLQPGLLGCALRELFEETGILLEEGLLAERTSAEIARLAEDRRRLLDRRSRFAELVSERGWRLSASPLVFAGRWRTPPLGPRRFDNRFFLLRWEERWAPEVLPGELESGGWIEPAAALERWRAGSALAAPPILHILRVLSTDGPEAGLERLRDTREANLGPVRRIEFQPGILVLPHRSRTLPPATHTNAYLVGDEEAVLVDPGASEEAEITRLVAALREVEARGTRLLAICLTHHHPDHTDGADELRRRLSTPILAHAETGERLARRGLVIDGELADDLQVELRGNPAMRLRVLHTPGHARGHLCLFEESSRSVLTGDLVSGLSTVVIDPPDGDMDEYLGSLDRLIGLEPALLFPGHGPPLPDGVQRLQAARRHRLWREERVLDGWRRGHREPERLVDEVYEEELPATARPIAERQIIAHLERLERLGRLEPDGRGEA